jgi:uncharacterized protein (TIGR02646 family)
MRLVARNSAQRPDTLGDARALDARQKLRDHYAFPDDERLRRRVALNPEIWNAPDVHEALRGVFRGKCAYCETPLGQTESGRTVDHFRPLSNAGESKRSFSPDHYGWLAYEWRNLYLACLTCTRTKANLFPVEGPRAPLLCSWSEAQKAEKRLLLDPCADEPSRHLRLSREGELIARTVVAGITISTLDLNRDDLVMERKMKLVRCLEQVEVAFGQNKTALSEFIQELEPEKPFSGSVLVFFFTRFRIAAKLAGQQVPRLGFYRQDFVSLLATLPSIEALLRDEPPVSSELQTIERMAPARSIRAAPDVREIDESRWRSRASARIRKVQIRNFKGIRDLEMDFPADSFGNAPTCAMLLGENSTGKSSILQAIALTLMGSEQRNRLKLEPESFLPRDVTSWKFMPVEHSEVVVEFDAIDPVRLRIDPLNPAFEGDDEPTMPLLAYGARRFFDKPRQRRLAVAKVRTLFNTTAHLQHPGDWLQGLPDREFDAIARAMREVLTLQPADSIGRYPDGQLFVSAHGRESPLENLSDGYRSLFAMVIDIMREMTESWGNLEGAHGLALIDELEVHLHPRWKMRVVSALRRAMPNVQFISTTHDPLCLRGMNDGEVHVLFRNEEQQVEEIKDLPNVQGMRAEQLLTSDFFGLASTSDPELEADLEVLALASSTQDSELVSRSLGNLSAFKLLGNTEVEQMVNEALRRYMDERNRTSLGKRGELRKQAVSDIVDALRSLKIPG